MYAICISYATVLLSSINPVETIIYWKVDICELRVSTLDCIKVISHVFKSQECRSAGMPSVTLLDLSEFEKLVSGRNFIKLSNRFVFALTFIDLISSTFN